MTRKYLIVAILFIIFSISLGAFGAHGLKKLTSDPKILNAFEVGVRYLTYTGLGLLTLTLNTSKISVNMTWPFRLISGGCIIFSGCLIIYTASIVIPALKPAAIIVPIGGVFMIIGWSLLLLKVIKGKVMA